jgi:hypothetical protein
MNPPNHFPWHVFGCTVEGASHRRAGRPNQDAIDWLATYGGECPLVALALADGHGGPRYVRSDVGAQLAVRAARAILRDLGLAYYRSGSLAGVKQLAEHRLPSLLVRCWQQLVDTHLAGLPLTAPELEPLGADVRSGLEASPHIAYGATLVATLATTDFLLYVQLGDGDIVAVDAAGQAERPPLPVDTQLFGDATTSFCMADAWRFVRTYFQPLAERPPELVLLATDGYANSFVSENDFLQAAADICTLVDQKPVDGVRLLRQEMSGWLRTTSEQGSGDDISLGILYRQP